MKTKVGVLLLVSHCTVGMLGFGLGIYLLPILIAPPAPAEADIAASAAQARYTGEFTRALRGSDAFHWGEGAVSIGPTFVSLEGELAPGPDYKLYLSPAFVETEAEFNRLKSSMALVGDIKTFHNFLLAIPSGVDPEHYTTIVVWCETFGEFITAARYR